MTSDNTGLLSERRFSQAPGLFIPAYLLITTGLIYLAFFAQRYDDPFITYRYAENIKHGLGFVYNPGERVLSTTTPLFTLLIAGISPVWGDLPHLANLIGAFSLALGGLFIWDLARTWKTPWVGWAGLLLYPSFSLVLMTIGSETPLYLALCLGAFALYVRRRYSMTALFCALAVLARPDGLLVPAILGAHYLITRQKPIPWAALAIFLAITVPWFAFAWIYFGSPLPVTLAVKQYQGAMDDAQRFAAGFITTFGYYDRLWYFWIEAGLAIIGIIWMFWRQRVWALFLCWTATYFIAYTLLGVSRYHWYYAPLVPGFVAAIGLGCTVLGNFIDSLPIILHPSTATDRTSATLSAPGAVSGTPYRRLSFLVPLALILALTFGQVNNSWRVSRRQDSRMAIYQAVGEWLEANTPPDASVGTLEVGAIGYYSQRPMVDFAGLIQPEVTSQLKTGYAASAKWAFITYHPDYLALPEGLFPNLEQKAAASKCQLVKRFSGSDYGHGYTMIILKCDEP